MLQLDRIMSSWAAALSPVFEWIHTTILSNPIFPSSCHHSTLSNHPNISAWLFGLSLACASHSVVIITRTIFARRIDFLANIFLALIIVCTNVNLIFSWLDHKDNLCVDFLGVELSPYLYIEWIITVPIMFLLVTWYSLHITATNRLQTIIIAASGGLSVVLLFLGNFPTVVSDTIILCQTP